MLSRAYATTERRQLYILLGLAVLLTIWQHSCWQRGEGKSEAASWPERAIVALAWPVQYAAAAVGRELHAFGVGLWRGRQLMEENRRLRALNEELAAQKLQLMVEHAENQRLRKLLGLAQRLSEPTFVASVVSVNYGLRSKRLIIKAEGGQKLEVGNIVRTEAGLVGRIIEVRGARGYVFPLIDAEHAVAGMTLRPPHTQGMVHAAPELEATAEVLVMDKVLGRANLREGDVIVTSGLGEVYPPGIPIGTIERLERAAAGSLDVIAFIRPFVDFDHLSYVLVQRHGG